MVEVKQDTQATIPAAKPVCSDPVPKTDHYMSPGEKIYNWTAYSGLNYWANLFMSLGIADYFTNLSGRKHLDKIIGRTAKALEATKIISLKTAHTQSRIAWETIALTSGGWILLAPLKIMEDHKRKIVHWINEKKGVDQTARDGYQLTPDEIYIEKEQPHQSWFNVIKRRIYASIGVVLAGSALEYGLADRSQKITKTVHVEGREPWTEERMLGGKQRATEFIKEKVVNKGLQHVPGGDKLLNSPLAQRWIELLALDSFFTGVTASIMRVTNGSKKLPEKNDPACKDDIQVAAQDDATSNAATPLFTNRIAQNNIIRDLAKESSANYVQRVLSESHEPTQPGLS
jgi:hypothetical protein